MCGEGEYGTEASTVTQESYTSPTTMAQGIRDKRDGGKGSAKEKRKRVETDQTKPRKTSDAPRVKGKNKGSAQKKRRRVETDQTPPRKKLKAPLVKGKKGGEKEKQLTTPKAKGSRPKTTSPAKGRGKTGTKRKEKKKTGTPAKGMGKGTNTTSTKVRKVTEKCNKTNSHT